MSNLEKWIEQNHLSVEYVSDSVLTVHGSDTYFYLLPYIETLFNRTFLKELVFNEDISELIPNIEELNSTYQNLKLLFEFGENFFYSEIKKFKDKEFNEEHLKVVFNDFKYIGKSTKSNTHQQLAVHSEYEILNSALNYAEAVKKAKFLGHKTIGICDQNTLAGTLGFQLKAKDYGLDFIIGETVSVCYEYDESAAKQITHNVKLYIKDESGWDNLLSINKMINVDNKGFVMNDELLKHSEGLILVVDYFDNVFQDITDTKAYERILNKYKKSFKDDLYFQFSSIVYRDERVDLRCLKSFKFYLENYFDEVKPVFIDDVYYLEKNQAHCKDLVNKIGGFTNFYSENQYMKTTEDVFTELQPIFKNIDLEDLLNICFENTNNIVDKCKFNIPIGIPKLPKYEEDGVEFTKEQSDKMLWDICRKGMEELVFPRVPKSKWQTYEDRLKREYDVISGAGFSDYFLILYDAIKFAKDNEILIGPGRGSVSGSLISMLMKITSVTTDPVENGLLFERFLNESRFKESFDYIVELENGKKIPFSEGEIVRLVGGIKKEINLVTEDDEIDEKFYV